MGIFAGRNKQIETTKPSDEKLKKMQALLSEFKQVKYGKNE